MNRPPFNKRELQIISASLFRAIRDCEHSILIGAAGHSPTRDAAAFARLRRKVEGMIQEKKR